jgi:hypothetical protein
MTEFKRATEFDRVYWDDYSGERYVTSHDRMERGSVRRSLSVISSTLQSSIPPHGSQSKDANIDSISTLFVYPFSDGLVSVSRSCYSLENSAAFPMELTDRRFHIKRSPYSEYNEQRIKFHLKF